MALINMCDSESYVGLEMRRNYHSWKHQTNEASGNPWFDIHQFTIYLPHPDQQYEDVTLEQGLSKGYNVDVEPVREPNSLMYNIHRGGHFVAVFKQHEENGGFEIAATGVFVRSLGILSLDVIVDLDREEYQPLVIKHPIIRDYPNNWETQLRQFLNGDVRDDDLSAVVGYVDPSLNRGYRAPAWNEVSLAANGFAGF
ncbi:MAG: hypothetical protein AB4050_20735 [Synechococcus sp.]